MSLEFTGAEAALDQLVGQFAEPLACLRELVQNSVDAGSGAVDVTFEHANGALVIDVSDQGEGMTREIIDARLTRLFSSSKGEDQTQIGRFGIGFVSVFALEPDAVCVDTARGGETWRVLFEADRSFVCLRRDEAFAGTRVRIIKKMAEAEAEALRARAKEVLRFWCRYVDAELYFDEEPITEEFGLDAASQVRTVVDGAELIVGFAEPAMRGFFNRGLTLIEEPSDLPGVSYRVSSPHLEHTLSRDSVRQDDHYNAVCKAARRIAARELWPRLQAALLEAPTPALWRSLATAAAERSETEAIFHAHGGRLSLQALRRGAPELWRGRPGPLVDAMAAQGCTVLLCEEAEAEACRSLGLSLGSVDAEWVLLDPRPHAGLAPLQAALRALFGALAPSSVELVPALGAHAWRVADAAHGALRHTGASRPLAGGVLLLAESDPQTERVLGLAQREPELAAVALARACSEAAREAAEDPDLMRRALERRQTR